MVAEALILDRYHRALRGLSTDVKPTNHPPRTEFIEEDTMNIFMFSGIAWFITHIAGVPLHTNNPYGATQNYYAGTEVITLASGARHTFAMVTPTDQDIIFKSMTLQSLGNKTRVDLHRNAALVVGSGGAVVPLNVDDQSLAVFPGTFYNDVTPPVGGDGVILSGTLLGAGGTGTGNSALTNGTRLINIRLRRDTTYHMEIHNDDTSSADITVEFDMGTLPADITE